MVEPLKKKNSYTNYNGEVFSPTNVGNIDLYNALVIISQQLDDIKHQHVESPEPKPNKQIFDDWLNEEPKGLIDTLRKNALDDLVQDKISKVEPTTKNFLDASDLLEIIKENEKKIENWLNSFSGTYCKGVGDDPGDNADDVLPIKAVPNSEYIKALLLRKMGKEPGLKSLGFDKRLRRTGYTTAIVEEVVSNYDVAILVEDLGHKDYVNNKSQDVDIKNDIFTLNTCLSGLPYHILMVDNSVDLYKNKELIKQLAQQYKVITFSDIK